MGEFVARHASVTKLGGMAAPKNVVHIYCKPNANEETCMNNKLIDRMRKLHCFINRIKIVYIQSSL